MDLSLMEQFADPNLIEGLSLGERMLGALITMVMGMGITFIVLILLWVIILVMTKLVSKDSKPKEAPAKQEAQIQAAATSAPAVNVTDEGGNTVTDGELIAVIMAAVEAYESGNEAQSNLIIRKINRATGRSTAWSRAGAQETIDSRNI